MWHDFTRISAQRQFKRNKNGAIALTSNEEDGRNSFSAQDAKYIDCILEEYKSIKEEISRRSTLQRVALVAYGAFFSFILKDVQAYYCASFELKEAILLLIWLASFVTQCFYIAEDFAIKRIVNIITVYKVEIQEKLAIDSGKTKYIFASIASLTKPENYEDYCPKMIRQVSNWFFFASYFLGIPLYFIYFLNLSGRLLFGRSDFAATPVIVAIWVVIFLSFGASLKIWCAIIFFGDRFLKRM